MTETITAIATPPGRGGVGIVRVSGRDAFRIAETITHKKPQPQHITFTRFYDENGNTIDEGLLLFFQNPHSFTGEDVVEFQGHGGPLILDHLLKRIIGLGARLAKPGEFSERAFLNGKIDLTQAEAIADLIEASSTQAAQSAVRSLCGEFSKRIDHLVQAITQLRMYVEAAIDFPEEEIDFLSDGHVEKSLYAIQKTLEDVLVSAEQGALLREGMTVVLTGKPNVGKSSLLNSLSGQSSAIVTQIPGTTRDILKESIHVEGMPLHILDTAGLRESDDEVEQEGIKRAKKAISEADEIIYITDALDETPIEIALAQHFDGLPVKLSDVTIIKNKIDTIDEKPKKTEEKNHVVIYLSAKENTGIDILREHLKNKMGFKTQNEGVFIARRRHIVALQKASQHLKQGAEQLTEYHAGELLAEELRLAQESLGEITGIFTSDDLLGKIFSSFCIGK